MARNRKSNRRSTNHRPEPDSGSGSRKARDDSHRRAGADRVGDRKSRPTRHSNSETRPRKHRKHRRHEVVTDTDGDYLMDKTQPSPKHDTHQGQPGIRQDTASSSSKKRHPAERPQRLPDHSREKPPERREAKKDYHFRRQLLALLEQQRQVVEAWADSLGAGAPRSRWSGSRSRSGSCTLHECPWRTTAMRTGGESAERERRTRRWGRGPVNGGSMGH
ncbi:unnamed protein product [Colletotrichum noveboracense]|uniref:Uncharacterized protein n=1 Tax=Colletotrichum noveboracense TaxID=2664923 RepID=A0A9W4W9L2_9PEZI|nr:unnamed protein product [Colletotrichum noveboracense]